MTISIRKARSVANKLKWKLSGQFVRNMGWLGGAELVNRVFRLATTVTLARLLNSYDYGLIAIILITHDFAALFCSAIDAKIIQTSDKDIKDLCNTAYWMNWILFIVIFILQCAAAFPLAWFYKDNNIILPICFIALNYLLLPIGAIQSSLIRRENRLNIIALINVLQGITLNVATVVLALLGFGIWSVILPFGLVNPIWLVINLKNHSWRPKVPFTLYRWQEVAGYSINVIVVEFLNKLRANLDYLIVGKFLGFQELGLYYFAFNAGLGISMNVLNVIVSSLFPHLCAARSNLNQLKARYSSSLKTIALIVIPLVLLQSSLAPFYVPIVFGQKWVPAIPILILICLSALSRPFAEAAKLLLLTVDRSRIALIWNLIFTLLFALSLIVAVQWGVLGVAAAVLITHVVLLPLFTWWTGKYIFDKDLPMRNSL
ncbi:lipopolysaccharide biosynthesis protein [Chroococcidiopsis sp. TS-821]|uniref:lipopolysaccharide biosynthesis protein n=1 Tax=Chroococcidiopsis sp. TS-821 TaxID=1378066 RepID=UPI000CEEF005|nr:lipopolysaccharide biosynthesis protein [Chroococcidiopsis sp. TS-821]PPS44723.1 lipopolysaccharide biosynthesis protein [Chroococcidiopsis sp. TS-821]